MRKPIFKMQKFWMIEWKKVVQSRLKLYEALLGFVKLEWTL